MKAGRQSSAMSLTGGGARHKRWRRPHERGLSVPKEPALLRDLEANQTAVHGSRRDRLDRSPLPWSAGRRNDRAARQTPRKSLKLSMLGPAKWNPRRRSCPEPRNRGHADVVRSGEVFQRRALRAALAGFRLLLWGKRRGGHACSRESYWGGGINLPSVGSLSTYADDHFATIACFNGQLKTRSTFSSKPVDHCCDKIIVIVQPARGSLLR
jgi:hypothetical protein